jgi:ribonuclease-3
VPEISRTLQERLDKDPKSSLQEMAQARMHYTPRYTTIGESGPDHAKQFTVAVTIGDRVYGRGRGPSKQQAAQAAAQEALELLASSRVAETKPAPDKPAEDALAS